MLSTDELSKVSHMHVDRKCILDLIQIKSSVAHLSCILIEIKYSTRHANVIVFYTLPSLRHKGSESNVCRVPPRH